MTPALGLDQPLYVQYGRFLASAAQGDLGKSFKFNESALKLIAERIPATLELAFAALFMTILLGIPLGLYCGFKPDSLSSKLIMGFSAFGFSVPAFWLGLMMVMVFAVTPGAVAPPLSVPVYAGTQGAAARTGMAT